MEFEDSAITAFLEAAATAVGVGMVLGGFVAGLAGLLGGWERGKLEFEVMRCGYGSAAACLALRLVDISGI
ncbi:MAG: hypothetical protein M3N56_03265 [Actinomycetota bacterium]|nr:hypothetical protein [Actinomycetota bacterium]